MHSHELTEAIAAVVLVIAGLVFVPASIWAYRRRDRNPRGDVSAMSLDLASSTINRALVVSAAALSFGAAIIHFAAVGPHLEEFAPYAYAFALLGAAQVVLGIGLLRGWPTSSITSILLSLGVVGVWVVSRTAGLPYGPEPWVPEAVGLADSISSLFELAIIALLLLSGTRRAWPTATALRVAGSIYIALVPIGGLIALITLIAVGALSGDPEGHTHG